MRIRHLPLVAAAALLFPACGKQSKEKAIDDLEKSVNELQDEHLRKINDGGLAVNEPMDTTRIIDALDKAGEAHSGQEKLAFDLLKKFVQRMSEEGEKLNAVSGDLAASLDYSGVKEKADLDALSEKIGNYRRVNAEVKKRFSPALIDELKKDADKIGLSGRARVDCFAGLESKFTLQLPLIHEIRDLDDKVCAVVLSQHDVLRKHFGEWSWKGEEGGLEFASDEALEAYNKLALELQAAAEKQTEVQRRLLSIR